MNAKELRISNMVFDENKNIAVINGFSPFGNSTRCDEEEGCYLLFDIIYQDGTISKNWTCDIKDMQPIPITEYWLLKFGFDSCGDDLNTWRLKSTAFSGYLFEIELNGPRYFKVCGLLVNHYQKIQFIHQLQNLFSALTGREIVKSIKQ